MSIFQLFTIKDCFALALFIGLITAGIILLFYARSLIVKSREIGIKGYSDPVEIEDISLDMIYAREEGIPVCRYCETLNAFGARQCCACRKPLPVITVSGSYY